MLTGLRPYVILAVLTLGACTPAPPEAEVQTSTAWAYPNNPPVAGTPVAPDNTVQLRIPGSQASFTQADLKNLFAAIDWQPGEHPKMPPVVAFGRQPDVMACGFCHLPTGAGRPENAALAGLPRDYIVAQMRAFQSGDRRSSVAKRVPTEYMARTAKAATEAEILAAADYFSKLSRRAFVTVVEADRVPKTRTNGWVYSPDPAGGTEVIGARIIEMPVEFERFERRDPATAYTAYVPTDSIARGARLAATWGEGGQYACSSCHGADLHGNGLVPALAGRSPTYIARQLNDFRTGARKGGTAETMRAVTAPMRNEDLIALAAFMASRQP